MSNQDGAGQAARKVTPADVPARPGLPRPTPTVSARSYRRSRGAGPRSTEGPSLDPRLRNRVLEGCLGRRPARIPVPGWAAPYEAETARLDAMLQDLGHAEWPAPVRLRWFANEPVSREP